MCNGKSYKAMNLQDSWYKKPLTPEEHRAKEEANRKAMLERRAKKAVIVQ